MGCSRRYRALSDYDRIRHTLCFAEGWSSPAHLSDKYPDDPEASGDSDQEEVDKEVEAAVGAGALTTGHVEGLVPCTDGHYVTFRRVGGLAVVSGLFPQFLLQKQVPYPASNKLEGEKIDARRYKSSNLEDGDDAKQGHAVPFS